MNSSISSALRASSSVNTSWPSLVTTMSSSVRMPMPRHFAATDLSSGEMYKPRSEEHTSELQSLMRISYAVFCLKKQTQQNTKNTSILLSTKQNNRMNTKNN